MVDHAGELYVTGESEATVDPTTSVFGAMALSGESEATLPGNVVFTGTTDAWSGDSNTQTSGTMVFGGGTDSWTGESNWAASAMDNNEGLLELSGESDALFTGDVQIGRLPTLIGQSALTLSSLVRGRRLPRPALPSQYLQTSTPIKPKPSKEIVTHSVVDTNPRRRNR